MIDRRFVVVALALIATATSPPARAHELWFQPPSGPNAATVRLTFADTPDPTEAERVAEIASARVWGDGDLLSVDRQADGLLVHLPMPHPQILSATAHRGVVDYGGDSFVITLAAYAQSSPLPEGATPKLGVDDDLLRFLLVADADGRRKVRATWRGKPAAGIDVRTFLGDESSDCKTDAHGDIPCPAYGKAGVSLLAQLRDPVPGTFAGKAYTHSRYKATLNLAPNSASGESSDVVLDRVRAIHGGTGPWAVVGYRIGERALRELKLPRQSFSLMVIHRSPAEVQYSCVADGLMAATGTSPGKLNLRLEPAPVEELRTTVTDRASGRTLVFTIRPEFARTIRDLPMDRLEAAGRQVVALPDETLFTFTETPKASDPR